MSADTAPPNGNNGEMYTRNRRGSITQAALTNLFQRGNSISNGNGFPGQSSGPIDTGRRRLSVTTLGLSGNSPTNTSSFVRRGSVSTNSNNSDSIDESAIEDDDMYSKTAPNTPFVRRMSFGPASMRNIRPNGSPGNDQQGFNWSEQLRSRAESSVIGAPRASFSLASSSPPRGSIHDRAKSVSEMPQPPAQASSIKQQPRQPERPKPDAFQERILKGDFYMD
ncbi:hypothetical protein SNK03_001227 [Fusarium graminearum]|uniref:Uncharacterized protein n=2 Tax=Gibberella zeae TaxID=5518 RepID=I1RBX5_GIBZE|nr:hypothetical protein FGSG_01068 [Fusarium graminearum PH-1]CAF3482844.1 unnamed protein product [Fusarium graminearum]ESU06341.1 hypothetical protein FGSG_01068 [Fusarium graminearum PH-1]CAF3590598.1 unnamed protein product [Fusarium graminearum]CAG1963349.1 unnamed protein product [Fusarium graminearum]CZS76403.1 unnamed protein product [Fusarium graminearum]|eukprot:XP_011316826.1 hypothetical protein FGSG_01068 [Fusarium graminearum PH-1]